MIEIQADERGSMLDGFVVSRLVWSGKKSFIVFRLVGFFEIVLHREASLRGRSLEKQESRLPFYHSISVKAHTRRAECKNKKM